MPKDRSLIEKGKRLSRSVLWNWQRTFFEQQGIEAWRGEIVPHHITSSPFIADSYARVLAGYLRDCATESGKPVHVIEIGSGSGRLAYLILQRLREYAENLPFKYVMTDISRRTIAFWRRHSYFHPLIEAGVLRTAYFDPVLDTEILLRGETVSGPLAVIANYVFDGIPQDTFHSRDGCLFEGLVTLRGTPGDLSAADISYHYRRARANYYEEPEWNRILHDYACRLPDTKFLFPISALRIIRKLERIAAGRFLLLSADRGYCTDDALHTGNGAPLLSHHGSVSLMVDYQILGEYVRSRGGAAWHPDRRAASLNVSAFLLDDEPGTYTATRRGYEQAIQAFGPDDLFSLKEGIEPLYPLLGIEPLLSFLRLCRWDYRRFLEMAPRLRELAGDLSPTERRDIVEAAIRVWEAYVPLGEPTDLAFIIGSLLLELGYPRVALDFFRRSVSLCGETPGTAHHMGICYNQMGKRKRALECFSRALHLDPTFEDAIIMESTLRRKAASPQLEQPSAN